MTRTEQQEPEAPERQIVKAAEDMPLDHFCLHMTNRHAEKLGGLNGPLFSSDYVYRLWLAYHKQLHARILPGEEPDHDHSAPRGRRKSS